jgi:membrane fusion protein, copper/silver efflux system
MSARANRLRVASACGLMLLACAIGSCDSAPHTNAAQQPAITVPNLVNQGQGQGQGPELLQLGSPIPDMTLAAVRETALPGVLETTGQIAFDDRRVANIVSRVTGRIEQIHVSQWDNVRRGQPIVTLYSPDFMTAEAEYLQAEKTAPALAGGGAANAEFAHSLVDAARRKLELLGIEDDQIAAIKTAAPVFTMRAPISGTVVQNQALRGSAVSPGDVLYSVGTLDHVWITADIYEDDLARVHEGQSLDAVTTAFPQEVFHGVIARVSPNIDTGTHTAQIRCEVANPGLKLKPQMLARVKIVVRPGQALLVPRDALVFESDSYFAYVDAGGDRLERRKVIIAPSDEAGSARVLSGLRDGERVVKDGAIQVNALWHQARGEGS